MPAREQAVPQEAPELSTDTNRTPRPREHPVFLSLAPKWMLSCKHTASFTTRLCWKTHMSNPGEQTRLAPCWRDRVQRQEQEAWLSQLKAVGESGRRQLQLAKPSWETRQEADLPGTALGKQLCHYSSVCVMRAGVCPIDCSDSVSSYHGENCQMNNRVDDRTGKGYSLWQCVLADKGTAMRVPRRLA